jgi:glycosyltransferase involved in cell wall biosynthesis
MPALFRSADVVVAVPWYEPFGIVPLEAMACGRPVVASAVGGMLDSVPDGRTGLLVPPKDPKALALRLNKLLGDEPLRTSLGAEGRRRAEAMYGWDQVAASTAEAYSDVCVGGARDPGVRVGAQHHAAVLP